MIRGGPKRWKIELPVRNERDPYSVAHYSSFPKISNIRLIPSTPKMYVWYDQNGAMRGIAGEQNLTLFAKIHNTPLKNCRQCTHSTQY